MNTRRVSVLLIVLLLLALLTPLRGEAAAVPSALSSVKGNQAVVVTAKSGATAAQLSLYEKTDGKWKSVATMSAVVGRNGLISASKKKEGDGCTPCGVYSFGTAFGQVAKPSGVAMAWKKTTTDDFWVDDSTSSKYNQWVHTTKNPASLYKSFEKLYVSSYKYALVINYNINPTVAGKGSAIFLHVWKSSSTPTSGCVAVSQANVLKILRWLNPSKQPRIVIEVAS